MARVFADEQTAGERFTYPAAAMILHEFLTANRRELIQRCRAKVASRNTPAVTARELDHGVPTFLGQLVDALRAELETTSRPPARAAKKQAAMDVRSRSAQLHGKAMQEGGYTLEQVIHDYGDICQAITELAAEKKAPVTVDEFHTFNRLLDNAMADAVSSFARVREDAEPGQDNDDLHGRLGKFADDQRVLLETALKALYALRNGNIGIGGATGKILENSLLELRQLIDRSMPLLRLSTRTTRPRKR